ncbi:MAG: hypothetical protein R3286_14335 [Gammaproteobacteria bacterium]|nr:hypothetical protein [Gammaproteobacteria bacterium]
MRVPRFLWPVPAVLLIAANAAADPMFVCGEHMIEAGVGTTKETVRERCGKPSAEDGNRWIYENRSGGKTVIVHFDGGTVSMIQEQVQ